MPLPYFRFPLVNGEEKLNVEVVVGPNPAMDLATASVRTLLAVEKCVGSVRPSIVPYREI